MAMFGRRSVLLARKSNSLFEIRSIVASAAQEGLAVVRGLNMVATQPISLQRAELECRLRAAPKLWQAIETVHELLPGSYVAGGAITQTVWNQQLGRPAIERLHDIDVVYFDPDGTLDRQRAMQGVLQRAIASGIPIDLTNQALTHTWYESKFAATIEPYKSAEAAIDTWLPAFAIGVRLADGGPLEVYTPYGLRDLFAMHIRPNKLQISRAIYEKMVASFTARWPEATAEGW